MTMGIVLNIQVQTEPEELLATLKKAEELKVAFARAVSDTLGPDSGISIGINAYKQFI